MHSTWVNDNLIAWSRSWKLRDLEFDVHASSIDDHDYDRFSDKYSDIATYVHGLDPVCYYNNERTNYQQLQSRRWDRGRYNNR